MDLSKKIEPHHFIHVGTDLVLCHGTRHVRVLTLPSMCSNHRLLRGWTSCLGDDEPGIAIEWPPQTDRRPNSS
jgi:hypothetical protein